MKAIQDWGRIWLILATVWFAACSFGTGNNNNNNGDNDAGDIDGQVKPTICADDNDCQTPETCQPSGYCEYIIDPPPNPNKLGGTFDLKMDKGTGDASVTGKVDGKYVYMEFAYVNFEEEKGQVFLNLYSPLTNDLYIFLVIQLPHEIPLDTGIKFGVDGVALGTLEQVVLDDNGDPISSTSKAEVIAGQVAFSAFGINEGDAVKGTFTAEFRVVRESD